MFFLFPVEVISQRHIHCYGKFAFTDLGFVNHSYKDFIADCEQEKVKLDVTIKTQNYIISISLTCDTL